MPDIDVDSVDSELPVALRRLFANVIAGRGDGSDGPASSPNSFTAGSNAPSIPAPPPDVQPPPDAPPASMGDFYKGASAGPSSVPTPSPASAASPGMPDSIASKLPWMPQYRQAQPQQPAVTTATGQTAPAGLTKAQKLGMILKDGLLGAMAGRAANEEAIVQSGGHRSGGAGIGFVAGLQAPQQQQAAQLNLQKEQAQTDLIKSQSQMVPTPMGPMPAGLAKVMFPAIIQGQTARDVQGQKSATAESVQGQKSDTAESVQGQKSAVATAGQRYKAIPGVGMFDTQTRQVMPGTAQGVTITPEIAEDHNLPDEFIGKPMKLSDLNGLTRGENQQETTVQGAAGPALVNKKTAAVRPLGLGSPGVAAAQAHPMEVSDEASPGNTKIVTGATAIGQGAQGKSSMALTVPKKAAASEVPTKIGDQKVAFNTMIQHAQLLRQAAKALNNGNVQALAGLQNSFKNQFGYSGPITAQAIADAYAGEVTNVISKGHITDAEMAKTGKTLDPSKQNFATINSVLGAYQNLAQSKMNMLTKQEQSAVSQSQRGGGAAPQTAAPAGATHIVPGPDGKRHYTNAAGTVDMGIAP